MPATGWKIDRNAWDALSANKVIAAPLAHHGNLRAARAEKDAFASAGVRFGVYVGLPDEVKRTFSMKSIDDNGVVAEKIDCPDWLLYQDVLLDYLSRLARDLQPAVYFLDGINWARRNKLTWMIDVRGVSADPVSTIVAVELGR
jgi:hypothetical protein